MSRKHGFTLIEILLALLIFTIVAAITTGVLYQVFNARERTHQFSQQLEKLQMAYTLLQRDISQCTPKSARTKNQAWQPAFIGTQYEIRFTRGGQSNPLSQLPKSRLSRIRYTYQNHQLSRLRESDAGEKQRSHLLLNDIDDLHFDYFTHDAQWIQDYVSIAGEALSLPRLVRVKLTLNHWGKTEWWFACQS